MGQNYQDYDLLNERGEMFNRKGEKIGTLLPKGNLGAGTFCLVDQFLWKKPDGEQQLLAVKRPRIPNLQLLHEARFQKSLHEKLKEYKIEFCVPEVYKILQFQPTGDIWFAMESHNPLLLSVWLRKVLHTEEMNVRMAELLLQLGLYLEVFESIYNIDHRDLKVNNILVIESPKKIEFPWNGTIVSYEFPFWICFVDFGFACQGGVIDIRAGDGIPPLEPCPKEGRDMFQVIVSIWYIPFVRQILEGTWGPWIRDRIGPWIHNLEAKNLDWLYCLTDDCTFKSPLCHPRRVIEDMIAELQKMNKFPTV